MRLFLLLAIFLLRVLAFSQINYTWAVTDTLYHSSRGAALAIDHTGSLVVAELNSPGFSVIKYGMNHQLMWRKDVKGYTSTLPSLCVDNKNQIYVAVSAGDSLIIEGVVFHTGGMVLLKFDSTGAFEWLQKSSAGGKGMNVSSDGFNIYVNGLFNGPTYFDTIFVDGPVVLDYVAKYTSKGKICWVRHAEQNSTSGWGRGLQTDKNGNSYISGTLKGPVKFGSISVPSFGSYPDEDAYVAKIDSAGNWLWATHFGGQNQDGGNSLTLDAAGNVYVSGFTSSNPAHFGSYNKTNINGDDYFLVKLDPITGAANWASTGGGSGSQSGNKICVTGATTYMGTDSKFLNVFDTIGTNTTWIQAFASNDAMVPDGSGGLFVTGYFQDSVLFGSIKFTTNSPGGSQMYIVHIAGTQSNAVPDERSYSQIQLYPNPTSQSVTIRLPGVSENCSVRVLDALGQEMYNHRFETGIDRINIQLECLGRGIYFIEVTRGRLREVKKVVVE